ncbi:MAG: hypothetical protein EPO65_05460 [Dehalococcoidia bacterium]|nr:MAG: hypothetical protein EPO65_05460 [Dehalococcoidia bacterium]
MTEALAQAAFIFFSDSRLPITHRMARDDFQHVATLVSRGPTSDPSAGIFKSCDRRLVIPVDGHGRTRPSAAIPDGRFRPDLWQRFANARPSIVQTSVAELRDRDPQIMPLTFEGAVERIEETDGGRRLVVRRGWRETDALTPTTREGTALGVVWPEPWNIFLLGAAVVEALDEWARLHSILAMIERGDLAEACGRAETMLARRAIKVTAPFSLPFWDVFRVHEGDEEYLTAMELALGVSTNSVAQLHQSETFLDEIRRPLPVTVLNGLLGYVWFQVVRELHAGYVPRRCASCGRLLPAGARLRTRYCGETDHPDCYKDRKASDRRRRRHRQLTAGMSPRTSPGKKPA